MLGMTGRRSLARVLVQCSSLKTPILADNEIRATSLVEALLKCSSLSALNLRDHAIGPAAAMNLPKLLGQSVSLETLHLGHNSLMDFGDVHVFEHGHDEPGTCASLVTLNLESICSISLD